MEKYSGIISRTQTVLILLIMSALLEGNLLDSLFFMMCQAFSIWFRSGELPGQTIVWMALSLSQSLSGIFPSKIHHAKFRFFYSARFGRKFIKPVPVIQFSIFQRILGGNYLHYGRKFQPGLNTRTLGAPEALGCVTILYATTVGGHRPPYFLV